MSSIPDCAKSFEFEPKFEPKNLEEYTVNPEQNLLYLKSFDTYSQCLQFPIKSRLFGRWILLILLLDCSLLSQIDINKSLCDELVVGQEEVVVKVRVTGSIERFSK